MKRNLAAIIGLALATSVSAGCPDYTHEALKKPEDVLRYIEDKVRPFYMQDDRLSVAEKRCLAEGYVRLADLSYENDNLEGLGKYSKIAINLDSNNADAHNNLGLYLHESGESKKAIESFKESRSINPGLQSLYVNMGVAYFELSKESKRYQKSAHAAFAYALKLDPTDNSAKQWLAYIQKISAQSD